jgi:hypothetical protein
MAGHLIYPIAGKLLQFMIKIDSDFVFEYLDKIDRECIFEGVRHEASLVANLIPVFEMLFEDFNEPGIPNQKEILQRIFDFEFSLDLISAHAGELAYILNRYPKMTIQHITDTLKRALDKLSKKEIIKMAVPLCQLLNENKKITKDYDKEFVNIILSLNPPKDWLEKYIYHPNLNNKQRLKFLL